MIEEIYYLVGPFGCGKTTQAEMYKNKPDFDVLLEDESMLFFLKNKDLHSRCLTYTGVMWYRILKKILESKQDILVVDSHPCVSSFYSQAIFELEMGRTYSFLDVKNYNRFNYQMAMHMNEKLMNLEQTVIYINIPLGLNWQMIQGRYKERQKDFEEENDFDYLVAVRRAFSQSIQHMAEELYMAEFVEIKDLLDIQAIIL